MFGRKGDTKESLYKRIQKVFDSKNIEYKVDEANYLIVTPQVGDDLPITVFLTVTDTNVEIRCRLAFDVTEENYMLVLEEINRLNAGISLGAFLIDPENKWVLFRFSYVYLETRPSENIIMSLLRMAVETVDAHDGPLKALMPITKDDKYTMMFV